MYSSRKSVVAAAAVLLGLLVATGCESDRFELDIAAENKCEEPIYIARSFFGSYQGEWQKVEPGQIIFVDYAITLEENFEGDTFLYSVASASSDTSRPSIWIDYEVEVASLKIGDGVDANGLSYEAILTLEGDSCL